MAGGLVRSTNASSMMLQVITPFDKLIHGRPNSLFYSVVLLRLFELVDGATVGEREVTYDHLPIAGLLCMAELLEVANENRSHRPQATRYAATAQHMRYPKDAKSYHGIPHHGIPAVTDDCSSMPESSNRTQWLFGAKFTEPRVINFGRGGQKYLLFTFNDLAVRLEGLFRLRDRRRCWRNVAASRLEYILPKMHRR
ncbi:hypothetical protein C8R46DRAFT_364877 [Mycena filopes]|nr:hypothetical protein C8R46DRAFT_364877 [Mycena filopes]